MSTARQMPTKPSWLSDLTSRFALPTNTSGMCYGLSAFALQTRLTSDHQTTEQQLWTMMLASEFGSPNDPALLIQLKESLTSIAKFQGLRPHPSRSGPCVLQSLQSESSDFKIANAFIGAYTKQNLEMYFESLREAIDQHKSISVIPLFLRNYDHAIAVWFDAEKNVWYRIDLAKLNSRYKNVIETFKTENEMANDIHTLFGQHQYTVIATKVGGNLSNLQTMTALCQTWKESYEFEFLHLGTSEMALRTDNNGVSILLLATIEDDIEIAKQQLKLGANINQTHRKDLKSPLWLATRHGNLAFVELCIKHNAAYDAHTAQGDTALSTAVELGYTDIVQTLLETAKATPTLARRDDVTPLYLATQHNHRDIAKLLWKAGANPLTKWRGTSPIGYADYKKNDVLQVFSIFKRGTCSDQRPAESIGAFQKQFN